MSAPQGLAHFGGITSLLSASYTLTHGITPGVCTLYVPPQPGMIFRSSPLVFTYGPTTITFLDCILDRIAAEHGNDGKTIWALHIFDRRWKWKFAGRISGYYNVRRGGEKIVDGTEATPQQLARLCLEAMGETRFDVSRIPDKARPEIDWDYTLPADALARLCDTLGCRVVLRLNGSVSIELAGVGNALPVGGDVLAESMEADPSEWPDSLVFTAGRTRYQHNFRLEAVGRDKDNVIKPIDDLSYIPTKANGLHSWEVGDVEDFNSVSDVKFREFAKESVFRWYRIKTPIKTSTGENNLEDLDRILPIEDVQVETWKVDEREEPRPAWVYGKYNSKMEGGRPFDPNVEDDLANFPRSLYTRGFTVETATGVVKFSEPVYLVEDGIVLPADLRLRTACGIREKETRGWIRHEVQRRMPGVRTGSKPRYLIHDDVALQYYYNYVQPGEGIVDNKADVEKQAEYYLDAAQRAYQWTSPASVSYAGLKAINPDGAIQQITWTIDRKGYATTRASRNREELMVVPSYKERRFIERLQVALQRDEKTGRQKQADQDKARA